MSMTLFVILSLALAAATLAILAWRGPAVAHVTDPAGAAERCRPVPRADSSSAWRC
jgi:hypothetical protein